MGDGATTAHVNDGRSRKARARNIAGAFTAGRMSAATFFQARKAITGMAQQPTAYGSTLGVEHLVNVA